MTATMAVLERAGVLSGLGDALRSLIWNEGGESAWQLSDGEVTEALSSVGQLRQLVEVAEVALAREGVERGLPGEASRTANDWLALAEGERAPRPDAPHVSRVLRVAKGARSSALVDDRGDLADAADQVEDEAPPPAGPAEVDGSRVHGLSEKELGTAITRTGRLLKPAPDLEDEGERAKRGRALYKSQGPAGMSTYKLMLDPEGAAVVDAAVAALAEPVKGPDGEPDERSAARRRADALVEVVRRGVSSPGEAAKTEKAQVMVTITLESLLGGLRGGGVTHTGEVLSPGTVRRMACDAGIVPVVLGGRGEVLELGRSVRWFTPGQKRAIWLRDQSCTYPGCTMPGHWCDAHHVDWWSRGGTTDVSNGALLCQRHHTRVHDRDLRATIDATGRDLAPVATPPRSPSQREGPTGMWWGRRLGPPGPDASRHGVVTP